MNAKHRSAILPTLSAVLSRRHVLPGLAAMGWGFEIARHPHDATARKKRKKHGDVNKLCKKQVEPCIRFYAEQCDNDPFCNAVARTCCPFFGACDVIGFQLCFIDAIS